MVEGKILWCEELEKYELWGRNVSVFKIDIEGKLFIFHFLLEEYREEPVNFYIRAPSIKDAKKLLKHYK